MTIKAIKFPASLGMATFSLLLVHASTGIASDPPCKPPSFLPLELQKTWCHQTSRQEVPGNTDYLVGIMLISGARAGTRPEEHAAIGFRLLVRAGDLGFQEARDEYFKLKLEKPRATWDDFVEVMRHLRRWAAKGDAWAAVRIALSHDGYLPRKTGLLRRNDVVTALAWMRIAVALGSRTLPLRLISTTESAAATGDQIAESKHRARAWLRKHHPDKLKRCMVCQ